MEKLHKKIDEYIDRVKKYTDNLIACDWDGLFRYAKDMFDTVNGIDNVYVEVDSGRIRFHILMRDGIRDDAYGESQRIVRTIGDKYKDIVILSRPTTTHIFDPNGYINIKSLV